MDWTQIAFWLWAAGFVSGAVLLGFWVYLDATARGSDVADWWGALSVVLMPVLLVYLLYQPRLGERTDPAGRRERFVGTAVVAFVVGLFGGVVVAPPDPFSQMYYSAAFVLPGLLAGYLLVWRRGLARLRGTAV